MYKLDEPTALEDFKSWISKQDPKQMATWFPAALTCPLARFLTHKNPQAKRVFVGVFVYEIDDATSIYLPPWAIKVRQYSDSIPVKSTGDVAAYAQNLGGVSYAS